MVTYKPGMVLVDYRGKPVRVVEGSVCKNCCYFSSVTGKCSSCFPCFSSVVFQDIFLQDLLTDQGLAVNFNSFEDLYVFSKFFEVSFDIDLNPTGFWQFFHDKGCIRLCDARALGTRFCSTSGITILPYDSVKHLLYTSEKQ